MLYSFWFSSADYIKRAFLFAMVVCTLAFPAMANALFSASATVFNNPNFCPVSIPEETTRSRRSRAPQDAITERRLVARRRAPLPGTWER